MYILKQAIHSHAHGKTFPIGAHVTERDFPLRTLQTLLADGTIVDESSDNSILDAIVSEADYVNPESWQALVDDSVALPIVASEAPKPPKPAARRKRGGK